MVLVFYIFIFFYKLHTFFTVYANFIIFLFSPRRLLVSYLSKGWALVHAMCTMPAGSLSLQIFIFFIFFFLGLEVCLFCVQLYQIPVFKVCPQKILVLLKYSPLLLFFFFFWFVFFRDYIYVRVYQMTSLKKM